MKIIVTLILLLTFLLGNAQFKLVNTSLLELEQNIYHKSFSKKWKKTKQSEWEKSCSEVKEIEELNKLFNEYSDLLGQTASFSMGNSEATNELEFAQYLVKVEGTLLPELVSKWDDSKRKKWLLNLSEYIDEEEQKVKEEELMRKFHVVTGIVKSFEKNFVTVWDDSKKNEFKTVVSGNVKDGTAKTSIDFKGAKESIIEDAYGVRSIRLIYDAENDEQMVEKIMSELEVLIAEKVGAGYKRTNEMDPTFENSQKYVYQFEGEKFAETAKRPTVTIGVSNNSVHVEITEPVFGH